MAYDEFNNSSFDLNGDGRIDSAEARRNLIAIGIVAFVALIFPDSPGIALFVGAMLLSAKISGVF